MTAKHKMTGSWHAESTNTPHCKVGKGRYSDNRSPGYLRVFLEQFDISLPLFLQCSIQAILLLGVSYSYVESLISFGFFFSYNLTNLINQWFDLLRAID